MYSLTRVWIDFPARQDADRRQQGRQQHEEQRDAVDAHVVVDVERRASRRRCSTNWKPAVVGSKRDPQQQRDQEGHQRGRQRDAAAVAVDGLLRPLHDQA